MLKRLLGVTILAAFALNATSIDPAYSGSYTMVDLGSVAGVTANYGGLTFLNTSTLLLGGAANGESGTIEAVQVNRDVNGHVTSFGSVSQYATAPYIDGGLAFGPGGVLFATGYPVNTVLEYLPGSTSPDKIVTLPDGTSSVGTMQFVPSGYPGAGNFILGSYNNNHWFTAALTPDGAGTYDIGSVTDTEVGEGGLEGVIFVPLGSPLFGSPSALVADYGTGLVRAYSLNSAGIPVTVSGSTFISGLSGAEGATIDPVTGDFLFSTFGGDNHVVAVQGFAIPESSHSPEPATFLLTGGALAGLGYRRFRTR